MSQDEMAALPGVAKRTIASWHERPEVVIRSELQRHSTRPTNARRVRQAPIRRQLKADDATDIQAAGSAIALTVAIAVVVTDPDVLIVCRRDVDPSGITWQFPAGIVKPGASAATIAVRETLAETGVHCVVRSELGRRVHPLTDVDCQYFLCDFLVGDVENRDVTENVSAIWAPQRDITRLIRIFPSILRALGLAP